jgi:hypothetical protein
MEEAVKENAELTRKERLAAWKESKNAAKPQAGAALKAGAAVKSSAAPKANKPTAMRPGALQPAKEASGAPSSSSQIALGKKRARSSDDDNAAATSAAAKAEPLQRLQKRLRGADSAAAARSAATSSTHTAAAPARKVSTLQFSCTKLCIHDTVWILNPVLIVTHTYLLSFIAGCAVKCSSCSRPQQEANTIIIIII